MAANDIDLVKAIGAYALARHKNHTNELASEFQMTTGGLVHKIETDDYRIEGGNIQFFSREARNRIIASHLFAENRDILNHDAVEWLELAHDLWRYEIGSSDSASGRLLAHVHKAGDIFSIAMSAITNKSMQVFDILHSIESSLAYLEDISAESVIDLVYAQHEATHGDAMGGLFINKIQEKLEGMPARSQEIHSRIKSSPSEKTANLYTAALVAFAKSSPESALDLALEDVDSPNPTLKSSAIWSLGLLLTLSLVEKVSVPKVANIILANMSSEEVKVRQTAIRIAVYAAPATDAFDNDLIKLGREKDPLALNTIANFLNRLNGKPNYSDWVRLLYALPPQGGGSIQQFDFALSQMLSTKERQHVAISCFTEWVIANSRDAPRDREVSELFNLTTHQLANQPALLSILITDWFLSDNKRLAFAAGGLLSYLGIHGLKNPEFDKERVDALNANEMLFLARRLAGNVIAEDHLLSLSTSLLKTNNAEERAYGVVYSLLVEEIGRDYPTRTLELLIELKTEEADESLIEFYSKVIDAIQSRTDALHALAKLDELRPSPSLQWRFAMARHKQMNISMEKAKEKSIMRKLAKEIPIKAGIGTFSFHDGAYTDTMHMQSISHSISIPLRDVFDTVGYELSHLMLRNAKRDEP